jgi:hydroxymethylbilane synthase
MGPTLRIATRSSPLALWQAERVAHLLGGGCELVRVESLGDRVQDRPIHELGGQGIFVKEVQAAVVAGAADIAVHSAKDLPSGASPEGLVLASVPERADVNDCLVGLPLDALPVGATVATGSVRRRAQLAAHRPDLRFVELRGNMATRLSKVPEGGAVVAAYAALVRLGWADRAAEVLDTEVMLPQVAQGALAVECRAGDDRTLDRVAAIEDAEARAAVDAERAFLAAIGSGCDLPVGALATSTPLGLRLRGLLAAEDGSWLVRGEITGGDPAGLARTLLARSGAP